MNILRYFALLTLVTTGISARAAVETYQIDPVHSSVTFQVRHFFTPVPGSFHKFDGTISVDRDDLEKSSVDVSIDTTSVDTANAKRNGHLNSADFFDTAKFPKMTFKSTSWKQTGDDTFDVTGDLTIKDVTQSVVLGVKLLGFGPGMGGAFLSGWEASTTLDRTDFGMTYGPGVVGNDVKVSITVEADRQD